MAVKVIREGVNVDLAALMAELSALFKMRHPNCVSCVAYNDLSVSYPLWIVPVPPGRYSKKIIFSVCSG